MICDLNGTLNEKVSFLTVLNPFTAVVGLH
jgi:hypothetical protein